MSHRGNFNKTHLSLFSLFSIKPTSLSLTQLFALHRSYMRRAFLPAVVSTSGRIHGDLLRLLYLLADNKTKRHFRDLDEAIDVDSEAYCWRRSGFFWRMRASLGLACAQATTLSSQVFGKGNPRSRAGRPSV